MTDVLALAGFVVACFIAAAVGGAATAGAVRSWYPTLRKPSWNPPAWLFGPVWSVLYLSMAVAAWLVWRTRELADVGVALGLFGVQLALNVLWSVLFFGLRRPGWAFVDIAVLWVAIAATAAVFWPLDRLASALLLPYLAWVTFAAALNASIARLNPSA